MVRPCWQPVTAVFSCVHTMPYMAAWARNLRSRGLSRGLPGQRRDVGGVRHWRPGLPNLSLYPHRRAAQRGQQSRGRAAAPPSTAMVTTGHLYAETDRAAARFRASAQRLSVAALVPADALHVAQHHRSSLRGALAPCTPHSAATWAPSG